MLFSESGLNMTVRKIILSTTNHGNRHHPHTQGFPKSSHRPSQFHRFTSEAIQCIQQWQEWRYWHKCRNTYSLIELVFPIHIYVFIYSRIPVLQHLCIHAVPYLLISIFEYYICIFDTEIRISSPLPFPQHVSMYSRNCIFRYCCIPVFQCFLIAVFPYYRTCREVRWLDFPLTNPRNLSTQKWFRWRR